MGPLSNIMTIFQGIAIYVRNISRPWGHPIPMLEPRYCWDGIFILRWIPELPTGNETIAASANQSIALKIRSRSHWYKVSTDLNSHGKISPYAASLAIYTFASFQPNRKYITLWWLLNFNFIMLKQRAPEFHNESGGVLSQISYWYHMRQFVEKVVEAGELCKEFLPSG